MNKARSITLPIALTLAMTLSACTESSSGTQGGHAHGPDSHEHQAQNTHLHADGSTHADHADDAQMAGDDHVEIPLDSITIDGMTIELAQGHGAVEANKEGHLIVKLPYNDSGTTIVRAWIGTEDRTLSFVGKGEYAPSHDDYDIHAVAPDPLPANTMWWIEIEKPDGTKIIGSGTPIM